MEHLLWRYWWIDKCSCQEKQKGWFKVWSASVAFLWDCGNRGGRKTKLVNIYIELQSFHRSYHLPSVFWDECNCTFSLTITANFEYTISLQCIWNLENVKKNMLLLHTESQGPVFWIWFLKNKKIEIWFTSKYTFGNLLKTLPTNFDSLHIERLINIQCYINTKDENHF
jgi:hypothetical protein